MISKYNGKIGYVCVLPTNSLMLLPDVQMFDLKHWREGKVKFGYDYVSGIIGSFIRTSEGVKPLQTLFKINTFYKKIGFRLNLSATGCIRLFQASTIKDEIIFCTHNTKVKFNMYVSNNGHIYVSESSHSSVIWTPLHYSRIEFELKISGYVLPYSGIYDFNINASQFENSGRFILKKQKVRWLLLDHDNVTHAFSSRIISNDVSFINSLEWFVITCTDKTDVKMTLLHTLT